MTGRYRMISRRRGGGVIVLLAILALFVRTAVAQTAEQRQIDFGKEIYKSKATCLFCHRWDGNGDQGYGGIALSLRKTELTHDQLIETIRCGRPGTGMPYHDQFAYTDKRCFDATRADLGDKAPPQAVSFLAPREVQAVVAFLEAKIKGRGPATLEECVYFWGAETKECDTYKN
jgi:Cytochrome C oxidase, cbb3-type, subunit III